MSISHPVSATPLWKVLLRGACGRCPRCGEGRLLQGYLKPVDACAACGERFGHIRADDGPAWLTILLTGHIVGPFLMLALPHTDWPFWLVMGIALVLTLVCTLAILPRAKGVFLSWIWHAKCAGSEG